MSTGDTPTERRRGRWLAVGGVIGLILGAAGAAASWDWVWWEPYNVVLPVLVIGGLFVAAIVFATAPRSRQIAVAAGILALGGAAGMALGPSRPPLIHGEGTISVTLSSPPRPAESSRATCSRDAGLTELQVSGDPNLRVDIFPDDPAAPPDLDQREFLGVSVTIGDRWRNSTRPDRAALLVSIGRVEGDLRDSRMVAAASSRLDIHWSADAGTATFAGLVPDTTTGDPPYDFIDIAGVIEWSCGQG